MITEEELKRFEQTASDDYEMEDHGNMEMRELIAEVRRLNAAYAQAVAEFTKSDDEHAEYFRQWLEHIFEPPSH